MNESEAQPNRSDGRSEEPTPNPYANEREVRDAYVKGLEEIGASLAVIEAAREAASEAASSDTSTTP